MFYVLKNVPNYIIEAPKRKIRLTLSCLLVNNINSFLCIPVAWEVQNVVS